jgi:Cys-tRNA(Pro)/Cys-tRNA(Cys) deacylase
MTPAVKALEREHIVFSLHEYAHDPRAESYGLEAAKALGIDPASVYKTLLAQLDGKELVVAIVPVENLRTFVDASVLDLSHVHVSGGRRGLEIEIEPTDLIAATRATTAAIAAQPATRKRINAR